MSKRAYLIPGRAVGVATRLRSPAAFFAPARATRAPSRSGRWQRIRREQPGNTGLSCLPARLEDVAARHLMLRAKLSRPSCALEGCCADCGEVVATVTLPEAAALPGHRRLNAARFHIVRSFRGLVGICANSMLNQPYQPA